MAATNCFLSQEEAPYLPYNELLPATHAYSNVPRPSVLILNLLPLAAIPVWSHLLALSHLSIFFLPPWSSHLHVDLLAPDLWLLLQDSGLDPPTCYSCLGLSWVVIHS